MYKLYFKPTNNKLITKLLLKKYPVFRLNSNMVDAKVSKRHLHPQDKEWINSIYSYNKNYIKNLPSLDIRVKNLIKSYFNFFSKQTEKKLETKRSRVKHVRRTFNKIYINQPEFKHTNSNLIINVYTYNRQYKNYLRKMTDISAIEKINFNTDVKGQAKNFYTSKLLKSKNILKNRINKYIDTKSVEWEEKMSQLNYIKHNSILLFNNIAKIKKLLLKSFEWNKGNLGHYEYSVLKLYIKKTLDKEKLLIYYKHLIKINKFKFENTYILKLRKILETIYIKKVNLNVINIKKVHLNTDILLNVIAQKLKKKRNNLVRLLIKIVNSIKLNKLNKILDIHSMYTKKDKKQVNKKISNINIDNFVTRLNDKKLKSKDVIANYIKYKKISGIRLQAKGRLTTRSIAERAITKINYNGSLKNIDSSYKGLYSVMIKGNEKSNIQYSKLQSNNKNGSFGLKGWLSNR